jgi:hypothetical protein
MNDALADSFMAPLREAQTRLAQLKAEITNKTEGACCPRKRMCRGEKIHE